MRREGLLELNEAVQHPGKKLRFEIETDLASEEDIDLLEPVRGWIEAVSTGNLLLVKSGFSTLMVTECARCGSPVEARHEFTMDDQFQVEGVPSAYAHDSFARVVTDEPEPLFQSNALVVDNYVRQGLIVSLPQQTLCSGSWEGPCQSEPPVAPTAPEAGHPAFKGLATVRAREGR
jgi:uncharacterized protein